MRRDKKKRGYRSTHTMRACADCNHKLASIRLEPMEEYTPPEDCKRLERKRKTQRINELIGAKDHSDFNEKVHYEDRKADYEKRITAIQAHYTVTSNHQERPQPIEKVESKIKKDLKNFTGSPEHRHLYFVQPHHEFTEIDHHRKQNRINDYEVLLGNVNEADELEY